MTPVRRADARCLSCGTAVSLDDRVCTECGEPTAPPERKVLTLLFADLSGYTEMCSRLDPEQVFAVMRPAMTSLRRIVETFGGTVPQIVGDGFMAVFGAPSAHEDDAERAVRAGAALQERLQTINEGARFPLPPLRVGVETGEVFVAASRESAGFSVSGSTVNLASRLCDLAPPGRCLVGPATAALVERVVVLSGGRRRRVKGLSEPVVVRELVQARPAAPRTGRRARSSVASPFVGREAELAQLLRMLEQVATTGRSAAVLVTGDPGQGKSRLAAELVSRATGLALTGRCSSYGERLPLSALADAVAGYLDVTAPIATAHPADAIRARVETTGVANAGYVTQGLLRLLGAGTDGDDVTAVRLLVEQLGRSAPILLVLDDVHWAEDELLDLVSDLAAGTWAAPVLVVALGRPETEGRSLRRITLPTLPPDAMREILSGIAGADVPSEAAGRLLDRAGGNPLFLKECTQLLVERGGLRRGSDGSVEVDDEQLAAIPSSMRMFIAARLDALPAQEKALIQEAAVFGERLWLEALGAEEAALEPLLERGLLRAAEPSLVPGAREYAFGHALVREVAYESVPHRTRSVRHAAVADWLLQAEHRQPEFSAPLALLAHHYHRAYVLARDLGHDDGPCDLARAAVRHLARWGDELLRTRARPAEAAYGNALEVARSAPQCIDRTTRASLHVAHATACVELGRLTDAEEDLGHAVLLAPADTDAETNTQAQLLQARTLRYRARIDEAADQLARLRPIVERLARPELTAAFSLELARNRRVADYPRLPWLLRDAYAACVAAGDDSARALIAHELAFLQTMEGGADFERWLDVASSLTGPDDLRGRAQLRRAAAAVALNRGEHDLAIAEAQAAESIAREGGFDRVEADALLYRLQAAGETGELDTGEHHLATLLRRSRERGLHRSPGLALAAGVRLAARRRDVATAWSRLGEARELLTAAGANFEQLDLDIAEVGLLLDIGRWSELEPLASRVVDALEPPGWGLYAMATRLAGARAALGAGSADAQVLLAAAVEAARRHGVPRWGAMAAVCLEQAQLLAADSASTRLDVRPDGIDVRAVAAENDGLRAWRAGQPSEAALWFSAAVGHWDRLGATAWLARALIWHATAARQTELQGVADEADRMAAALLNDLDSPDGFADAARAQLG